MKFDQQPPIPKSAPLLQFNREERRDQVARRQPPIPGSEVQTEGESFEMFLNAVTLIGRLAKAPQLRYLGERAVVQLTLAVKNGASSEADVIPISVFGTERQLGDLVALDKGALLAVQGRIARRAWEGLPDLEVVATDVQIAPATQVTNGRGEAPPLSE